MTDRRLQLHEILVKTLGSSNVYFQPPETIKLKYPCIIYTRDGDSTLQANDGLYRRIIRYTVTVIDKNPDSKIPDRIAQLKYCSFNRHFTYEGLNHDVFELFY